MNKAFYGLVAKIQSELKAPKNQLNKFGGYKYRNCEDILEAVKPLLNNLGLVITINDELINMGNRFYIKATATISDGENSLSNSALAREAEVKKGMDESQITGAASSYARKYALNGLLLIDDTKDADATETHNKENTTGNFVGGAVESKVEETVKKSGFSARKKLTNKPVESTTEEVSVEETKTQELPVSQKRGGWAAVRKKSTTASTSANEDIY